MSKKLVPLDDHIVVLPDDAEEKTHGGIVIPDTAQKKPARGKVIAVGPGAWSDKFVARVMLSVEVGDIVLYGKYSGIDITHEQVEYKILRESDLLAKLID